MASAANELKCSCDRQPLLRAACRRQLSAVVRVDGICMLLCSLPLSRSVVEALTRFLFLLASSSADAIPQWSSLLSFLDRADLAFESATLHSHTCTPRAMQPIMFGQQQQGQGQQQFGGAGAAPFPNLNFYSAGNSAPGGQMGGGFGSAGTDFGAPYGQGSDLSGSMGSSSGGGSGSVFDDEPPLLEELGINFKDIWSKTLAVSIPFRAMPTVHEEDADLAGPLVFCLLLGTCLLLTGKVHFGYIYGAFLRLSSEGGRCERGCAPGD